METVRVEVTAALANDWLSRNNGNRPMSKNLVEQYALAMKRGEWLMNGETVKFSSSGRLIDGQHRLKAICATGKTVSMLVVTGLADDSFKTIDAGKKRSASDVLSISGEKNSVRLAAVTRAFIYVKERDFSGNKITNARLIDELDRHPALRFWVSRATGLKVVKQMPSSVIGVCAYFAELYGSDTVDDFLKKLDSGVGLMPDDPAYQLREKFLSRNRGVQFTIQVSMAFTIKAINAHISGKPLKVLRMTADEQFPEIGKK